MAVTITVGTGGTRNYTSIATALSHVPANISSSGSNTPYIISLYNDGEFYSTSGILVSVTGITTDTTNTLTFTAAAGQSFVDNANATTNPGVYNQSYGVGLRVNVSYTGLFFIGEPNVYVNRLQMYLQGYGSGSFCLQTDNNNYINQCILQETNGNGTGIAVYNPGSYSTISNSLIIANSSNLRGITAAYDYLNIANCTVVAPSDVSNSAYGIAGSSEHFTVTNTACFGFATNFYTSAGTWAGSNNASNGTIGFGSANQQSLTYANQFVGVTSSAMDFRIKASGSSLVDNGTADTTDVPAANDIVGTSRPQGSAWDIGAYELVVASGNFTASLTDTDSSSDSISIILYPVTPASDIITAGWTAMPSGSFYTTLNEVTENDSNYVTSPAIPTTNNITFGLSATLPAGNWTMNIAAYYSGTSGKVRAHLQNSSGTDQGVSSWITLGSSVADYQVQITTTGASTQVMLEVEA